MSNTRPCLVKFKKKDVQALFHEFFTEAYVVAPSLLVGGAPGGQLSTVLALVEYADGTLHKVYTEQVQFLDTKLRVSLNSDKAKVKEIQEAVRANDGYCPCELHKTPDTKCVCEAFRKQTEPGPCHCGLYVKEITNG